jgi:hypothetical protein
MIETFFAAPPAPSKLPTTILMKVFSFFENFSRASHFGAAKSTICVTFVRQKAVI